MAKCRSELVENNHAVVNDNCILSNQNLKFNVEILAVRKSTEETEEEIAHS
ncbi:MAG: hypothetical protein ACSLEL_01400 [Candidatus Malihini olakiniferum]